jgi:hypothetical protein
VVVGIVGAALLVTVLAGTPFSELCMG